MYYKRISLLILTILGLVTTSVSHAKIEHILPRPQEVTIDTGNSLVLQGQVRFTSQPSDRIAAAFQNFLNVEVTENASVAVTVNIGETISGSFDYTLEGYDNEAYKLIVATTGITIDAVNEIGAIRAIQTLAQMAEGYDGTPELECCTITDWPAFKLRGLMHDIGRSFISFEELKKQLKLMARFKVNTFHFHLTENQGWRFEVEAYPQLTSASSMTRFAGEYYTQAQCRELEELANQYGITVIPEIDMPGHSGAFERAMGHSMQTEQGVAELKNILTEVVDAFPRAPYIHIGADEVNITYPNFLKIMTDHIKQLGKKVVFWNPIKNVAINTSTGADMTQMWSSSGKVITGMPNIDCRYNYINHFDLFADVVGIYKSNIYYAQKGSSDIAGTITAVWNDRYIEKESDIMLENNVYANLLASAERAWIGGGKQYIEVGGTTLPTSGEEFDEFADWERRFLFHKANSLKDEPIPYVKQTNVRWKITEPFPNNGNVATIFPPETIEELQDSYTYNGKTYGTGSAVGAGIYLRHVWGTTVPSYFSNPQTNTTAYAWTYVYSPVAQQAGAIIEFQNYSRSEDDVVPANYSWDKKGSRIWFNDTEIDGPKWDNAGVSINNETPLRNENAVRRKPVVINLKQGWNKVFMKLPYISISTAEIRLNKWMFTFVITDKEGKNALEGLVYSPDQILDDNANDIATRISEINGFLTKTIGTELGFYSEEQAQSLRSLIEQIKATLSETMSESDRNQQLQQLNEAFDSFQANGLILPKASTDSEEYWYNFCSTLRGNRYTQSNGAGSGLTGNANNSTGDNVLWKFVLRSDGTYDIINRADGSYISPSAAYNSQISTSATQPSKGWTLKASGTLGMLIITCGEVQLNQTNISDKIYNWSNQATPGNDTTDGGCQFTIRLSDTSSFSLSNEMLNELEQKAISVAANPANNLTTGQWYVMFDRGTNPGAHGYLYEKVSEHALWNSSTVPSGTTTSAAKYLVRLSDAGDGKYYVQTGYGNYFGAFAQGTKVAVTSLPEAKITIGKIANTDGHFYLQSSSSNIILDANDVRSGDATVVGWGNTIPTSTGGNNDWAFYPVTLEDIDPSSAVTLNDVTVTRGYQTCGRGNENSLMLRIDLTPSLAISNATINLSLNEAAKTNLSNIYIYETTAKEFIANIPSSPIATATVGNTVSFNIGNVSEGLHHFWLCATVKDDAELGAILEASLTGIDYTCNSTSQSLDVSSKGTLTRQGMKVYNQQTFVFKPTTDNNRYYRIPAMILDKNGNLVVAIDRRYNSNSDLGNHKIDVSIKRSEDNGRTWSSQKIVAVGNTDLEARYGYGDAALARTKNGRIICLMACGKNMYFGTGGYSDGTHYNKWVGMLTSDDNGVTWQGDSNGDPILITEDVFGGRGQSLFVSSGKGVTTEEGAVMFSVNVKRAGNNTSDCYILKTEDEGATWTLLPNNAYSGTDESKLEQLNDGQLLLSVRQSGNRGWNTGSADGMTWGEQYRSADISGNACNADLIYYSRTTKGAKRDIMLHSYINTSDRESLQLAMSIDGGKSWHDVYNIQPNGSCYSTMQVLNDGSLAILYEDESYSADNGFAITYVTITKDQINEWCDELPSESETPGVIVVEHGKTTDGSAPFVTWQETTNGNWAKTFTTNAATGVAGVVVSTDSYAFNRQTSYGQRVLVMKPTAAGAQNDVFTITAPDGYLIEGYSIGGYFGTASETYTLTAENGASVAINKNKNQQNPPNFLNVTDINAKSTTFKMSNNNTANSSFAVITQFIVYLKKLDKKSLVLLDDDREVEYPNADRITDNLEVQAVDVTLHGRTLFKDNSWNTLCLPFAINDFAGTPLEDAEVRSLENASFNNGTLTLNFSEGLDAIEAGKPYIVRWTSGDDIKNPVFTNVQFDNTDGQLMFDNVGLIFKGTFTPFVFEAQDKSKLYMGNENKLLYPKKTMAIKAFRAFFDLGDNLVAAEPSAAAGAKEITNFVLNFGETTEIGASLNDNGKMTNDSWYSIDGRRLNGKPTQKGVYIVNGKKIVK